MGRRGTEKAKCRRAFAASVGVRRRAGVLLACGLGVLAPALAAGQEPVSAEEANAAFERFEQARIAAFEGDEAERYRAAIAELDTAAADLRQIESAVVAAVQEERAAVWGEPTTDERFVWVEYSADERERRQVDFAREALVFESLDGGIEGEALRRRVRAALVESIDEAVARDPIAQGIETQAAATLSTEAPLESGALTSTPILWPVLTGDARVEESALEAVVGLLVARAQTRQVEIGGETMQQVEIPLDPATVLAQLERLERGDFAAPMPGFTPQEIPRPIWSRNPRPRSLAPRRPRSVRRARRPCRGASRRARGSTSISWIATHGRAASIPRSSSRSSKPSRPSIRSRAPPRPPTD